MDRESRENCINSEKGYDHRKLHRQGNVTMEILLFANDNILTRTSFTNYLESIGYKIDPCADGLEALKKFQKNQYDLILLDMNLPSISGLDLVKKIREEDEEIPMLVFCVAEGLGLCDLVAPYVQGKFSVDASEKEVAEKIEIEIKKYKERMDATG